MNDDWYLTRLGTLMVRSAPIDESLEELLAERPGGDAQIQRVRSLHDQLVILQNELEGLIPFEPFAELQSICQKIFRHNIEGCRLLELAIVSRVQTLFRKAGASWPWPKTRSARRLLGSTAGKWWHNGRALSTRHDLKGDCSYCSEPVY